MKTKKLIIPLLKIALCLAPRGMDALIYDLQWNLAERCLKTDQYEDALKYANEYLNGHRDDPKVDLLTNHNLC